MIPLNILEAFNLIWRYKTYEIFIKKPKALTETEYSEKFAGDTKLWDWVSPYKNFLRIIPGIKMQPF